MLDHFCKSEIHHVMLWPLAQSGSGTIQ